MTNKQITEMYKHEAKTACRENGIKVYMNHMTLLETGFNGEMVDYVMFCDRKTGKEYQCYAAWKYYTSDHKSKWIVTEYKEEPETDPELPTEEKPAQEAQEQPTGKTYTWTEGHAHEETASARTAMEWHRMGRRVTVWGYRPDGSQYHVTIPGAKQPERNGDDENRAHCKHIAHELEAYAEGHVYRCPDCGEEIRMPDNVGDKYRCPHCHNVADVEDYEQLSVYDFLSDVYDIEYRVGSDGEYRSAKIMVACGGPNIYIDTAEAAVKLYWWSDRAEYPISYEARDAVDEWAEELWGCR